MKKRIGLLVASVLSLTAFAGEISSTRTITIKISGNLTCSTEHIDTGYLPRDWTVTRLPVDAEMAKHALLKHTHPLTHTSRRNVCAEIAALPLVNGNIEAQLVVSVSTYENVVGSGRLAVSETLSLILPGGIQLQTSAHGQLDQ